MIAKDESTTDRPKPTAGEENHMLRDALFSISLGFGGNQALPPPPPPLVPPPLVVPAPGWDVQSRRHHHHHFDVMYRTCSHEPWRIAGSFDLQHQAEHIARKLQRRGFSVRIQCH
jgi:hypothetical protein